MGDDGCAKREHADGVVRARGAARRGGDRHARDLPVTQHKLVLYTARGCHLCEHARETLAAEGASYDEIDITDDPELERAYREWLPVLEIDGERAFVYRIPVESLRRRLGRR